ncbi:hypothetical protein [Amycolatopsis sp. CA-230715]|uniref:hypothetical protein n=1 Tax=Amycolatopsis sp. CA-230715 TaxID=2745196 RepID=UPI001C336AE4|nr:hypothetical protein [Amycolatopsis sp. CA-230715]QWF79354.1 hypothetical protein HUW46_02762 [Amycolatopsis sp. CA-230715]
MAVHPGVERARKPVGAEEKSSLRLVFGVGSLAALVFALASAHLIDDTYITLSYARNLAFHGRWGLLADATANTATSPLNVLTLGALTFVTRNAVFAAGVSFVVSQVLTALALRRIGAATRLPRWFAPVTTVVLVVNPVLLSSIGLEVALGVAGTTWLLVFAHERRPFALGLVAGVLALVRLDLLVVAAVVVLARRRCWAGLWRTALGAGLVAAPWFALSWFALGAAVPDTLVIKTQQGAQRAWGQWDFSNGPALYWRTFPWQVALSFAPVVLAAVAGLMWTVALARRSAVARRTAPFAVLALAGAAYCIVYIGLRVPPYHWYYGPGIACATVFLCAVAASLRRTVAVRWLAAALAGASAWSYAADGLPRDFAPITSNYTSSAQYAEIGREIGALVGDGVVASAGEIGVLAYTCDCAVVDVFSDRGLLRDAIAAAKATAGPVTRALLEVNFRFFAPEAPRRADFVLERHSGGPPPGAVAHWRIAAPMLGPGDLYLRAAH